jgi:hypothetical protein
MSPEQRRERGHGGEPSGRAGLHLSKMMTSERQIWEAAMLLVRRHGEDAADVAGREAKKHGDGDDELTYVVWCWIARATAELIKAEPEEGERVH